MSIGYCSLQEKALQKGDENQEQAPSLSRMAALLAVASAFIINNIQLCETFLPSSMHIETTSPRILP